MEFTKVTFFSSEGITNDILIAWLDDIGYIGFEENDNSLSAYIDATQYNESLIQNLAPNLLFSVEHIPEQNWNAIWEQNFEPVVVGDFCTIRASFHDTAVSTKFDLIITPKMSFGTGHHATTRSMISLMSYVKFVDKNVLDFGTGTGVLAILASKLGAAQVVAIDNDDWSVENAIENVSVNRCTNIKVQLNSLPEVGTLPISIILANINKNVLLQFMNSFEIILPVEGILILSGILAEDETEMVKAATVNGFTKVDSIMDNNWLAIKFQKKNDA